MRNDRRLPASRRCRGKPGRAGQYTVSVSRLPAGIHGFDASPPTEEERRNKDRYEQYDTQNFHFFTRSHAPTDACHPARTFTSFQ
jgi:hypothetical protein